MKITLKNSNKKISIQTKLTDINNIIHYLIIPILLAAGYKKCDIIKAMITLVRTHKDDD